MTFEQRARDGIVDGLGASFLFAAANALAHEYEALGGNDATYRSAPDAVVRRRKIAAQTERSESVLQALGPRYGFHPDWMRLQCNGQHKLILRSEQCILLAERTDTPGEPPRYAEYKKRLARAHSLGRQLLLPFPNWPQNPPFRTTVPLYVLLHGEKSFAFEDAPELGILQVGVPDASYAYWHARLDLWPLAVDGDWQLPDLEAKEDERQVDLVRPTLRASSRRKSGDG